MVVLVSGVGLIGCGNDKKQDKKPGKAAPVTSTNAGTGSTLSADGDGSAEGGRYTAEDFPKGTQLLGESEVKKLLTKELNRMMPAFVMPSTEPSPKADEETKEASDTECPEISLNAKWTGNAKSISLKISEKVSCKKGSIWSRYDRAIEETYFYTCPVDAFATIVGKTIGETGVNLFNYCKNSKPTYLFNNEAVLSFVPKEDPKKIIEYRWKWALSKADGTPCTFITTANAMEIAQGCQGFSRVTMIVPTEEDESLDQTIIGTFKGVKGPLADKPRTSGSFDFSFNGWKGAITFKNTPNPAFQASDGTSIVRGTLE